MSDEHPLVARYMKQFERSLEALDIAEGKDIAAELKGHVAEALANGKALDATLESLGPADALARAYAVELHMNQRKERNLVVRIIRVTSILAASGCLTFFVSSTLGILAVSFLVTGVLGVVLVPIELAVDLPYVQVAGVSPFVAYALVAGCLALGLALTWLFWLYLRSVGRALRKSLPRAWAVQPA
jgi:uncharacterized membrane protein